MNKRMRGAIASLILGVMTIVGSASAADKTALTTEKDKLSYAIGMDVANSFQAIAGEIDLAALQRGVETVYAGNPPTQTESMAQETDQALRRVLAHRAQAGGSAAETPTVSKEQVGLMLGERGVGPALIPLKEKIDLPVVLQGLRSKLTAGGGLLMTDEEAAQTLRAFIETTQQENAVRMQQQATRNREEGQKFLAENKTRAGVVVTPSGLQYQVLREGNGRRPAASNEVRVNYEGKLLDGTVFDSSYQRGAPAEFRLDQVIPGWTEGVALMPIGSKYRFWIPSQLAYGARGAPGGTIGPDATLQFDVELLDITK